MRNLRWKYMEPEHCMECYKVIKMREKMVLIYKDDSREFWVHDGECYSKYSESLTHPEARKDGIVIGICELCLKPVRYDHPFDVSRDEHVNTDRSVFETTMPQKNAIRFTHRQCIANM